MRTLDQTQRKLLCRYEDTRGSVVVRIDKYSREENHVQRSSSSPPAGIETSVHGRFCMQAALPLMMRRTSRGFHATLCGSSSNHAASQQIENGDTHPPRFESPIAHERQNCDVSEAQACWHLSLVPSLPACRSRRLWPLSGSALFAPFRAKKRSLTSSCSLPALPLLIASGLADVQLASRAQGYRHVRMRDDGR